jgi:ABC-type branched-subunit amino acid transport system ATPase component
MLRVRGLRVGFGRLVALDGVDLEVGDGEAVGLMGPNGSGKTTLLDAVSGLVPVQAGAIEVCGQPARDLAPDAIARLGLGRCFQAPRLLDRMDALANVRAGQLGRRPGRDDAAEAAALLAHVGLGADAGRLAGELPPAARRRLELARALAARPRLLLLDEPCSGLSPAETQFALGLLREAAGGRALLVVEHRMPVLRRLCARVVVLDRGRVVADGSPDEVATDRAIVEAYLGRRA